MKKLMGMAIILTVALASASAMAGTDEGDLDVMATVTSACRVTSTGDVDFGNYDPTDPADNIAGQGFGRFRCTKDTDYGTYIVRTNTMTDGTDNLTYELYSDAGRSSVYPSAGGSTPSTAANNGTITADIYGKITAQQDVEAGAYSETVTFTVEY